MAATVNAPNQNAIFSSQAIFGILAYLNNKQEAVVDQGKKTFFRKIIMLTVALNKAGTDDKRQEIVKQMAQTMRDSQEPSVRAMAGEFEKTLADPNKGSDFIKGSTSQVKAVASFFKKDRHFAKFYRLAKEKLSGLIQSILSKLSKFVKDRSLLGIIGMILLVAITGCLFLWAWALRKKGATATQAESILEAAFQAQNPDDDTEDVPGKKPFISMPEHMKKEGPAVAVAGAVWGGLLVYFGIAVATWGVIAIANMVKDPDANGVIFPTILGLIFIALGVGLLIEGLNISAYSITGRELIG